MDPPHQESHDDNPNDSVLDDIFDGTEFDDLEEGIVQDDSSEEDGEIVYTNSKGEVINGLEKDKVITLSDDEPDKVLETETPSVDPVNLTAELFKKKVLDPIVEGNVALYNTYFQAPKPPVMVTELKYDKKLMPHADRSPILSWGFDEEKDFIVHFIGIES